MNHRTTTQSLLIEFLSDAGTLHEISAAVRECIEHSIDHAGPEQLQRIPILMDFLYYTARHEQTLTKDTAETLYH